MQTVGLHQHERFGQDLSVLRLQSDRGAEFSSDLLRDFCRGEGILQSFTLPDSPQQNGIAERRIGLVMEVARTSMIHAAAPYFLWPFAVRYAVHELNLWPRVALPETSPTLRWTGKVGDASVFRVWGSRAFVRDTSADKLSARAIPCVFLGFVPDAPGWQFYHPTSRRVLPSQDVTFDESAPFYCLFPYRSAPSLPPPLFLAPGPPPVDPLPPQGPAPSRMSHVHPLPGTAPVQVVVVPGAPLCAASGGAASGGAASGGAESGGAGSEGAGSGGAEPKGVDPGGAESEGADSGGAEPRGAALSGGPAGASPRLSSQQLREWLVHRPHRRSGAPGAGELGDTGAGGAAVTTGAGDPTEPGAVGAGGFGAGVAGVGGPGTRGAGAARAGALTLLGLQTTLAALGFVPSTADPSLFLRTDTSLPPFYVLVYVDDVVFATTDTEALTLVKSFSASVSSTPRHSSLLCLPATRSQLHLRTSGPYLVLVGCLMYLMTCTRPDLAYPLSLLAHYVAPGRHRKVHWDAVKRVLRYLCSTSGMRLVLGGRGPVVLTGHADASLVDDSAMQRSSQGYTFSLGSGSVSWRSTRSFLVLSSSYEAEIYAGAMAAQELRWLTYFLTDLGEHPRSPPVLYQRGQLRLAYVATQANTADVFTEALPPGDHQRFITVLFCFASSLDWSCDHCLLWLSPTSPMGLYLLSDSRDSVSLLDHTSGASPAPPATANSRLLLPYPFPELSAFATLEDLVSHLCTSDARYRAAAPAEDHFLSLDPTVLTIDRLKHHLLAAKTSVVAVGAARATPRTPFFEGCSPSPLAPSYYSAAAVDVPSAEDVGAASASAKRRSSKGKGGRGGGGGSGSGGGGSSGGCGGSGGGGSSGSGGTSGGFGGSGGGSGGSGGSGSHGSGGGRTGAHRGGSGGGQMQRQQCLSETLSPQQLREWFSQRGVSGGSGSCPYVIRTGDRAGQTCGKPHTKHRCSSCLDDAWRAEFGDVVERPHWAELLWSGVAIFDLDYDAIIFAMYALSASAEGDYYRCVPPDPGASRYFFRDSTTLTPLPAAVPVRLTDPSVVPVVARSSTVLPCLAVPTVSLSGLHLPSFSTNLVSTVALQDSMVTSTTPGGVRVRSGSTPLPGRLLSHQTLFWHHRPGHPYLPRLRGMHSRPLVSSLPRSLPPLPPSPAQPCLPCVEWRQRAAPHSSFPPPTAPLQNLHMDMWGQARVNGQGCERYFLLVVDDYTRYTTVFPFCSKGRDLHVLRLHSNRGGEFSSDLLRDFCRGESILQSFTLPASPQKNGIAERRIGFVMEVAALAREALELEELELLTLEIEVLELRVLFLVVLPPLQPASPLPALSPYTEQSGGLTERCEPASRSLSPVRTTRWVPRLRPHPVPGTHTMALHPSSVPLRVPLPPPPESSPPAVPDPGSDLARAASPTVSRLLATIVTDPSTESTALVGELLDGAAACRLDYATALVAESESASPPSVGGESALGTDVHEDRQEDFECLAAAVPRFASVLLGSEGDPDAPDISTPRSYVEAITGPYSSQWQAAMDAEMASWKSTCTYIDAVPPSRVNIVDGNCTTTAAPVMASPCVLTFDAEGRAVDFDVWLDDLQLFLQCDSKDGLSLLDLTSGASTAPAADADSAVRSQWLTPDAAAHLPVHSHLPSTERTHFSQYKSAKTLYDAVVARYSSPATTALSRLMLPYLFPDLRTSDTRYRATLPAEFCAKNPPPMYITLYYLVTRLPDTLRSQRLVFPL
ncbi:unnamed protein product [Closterium sp. NIES-53]